MPTIRIRKSAVNSIVGQALRDYRIRTDMSLEEAKGKSGLKNLKRIEEGETDITLVDLYRLSVVYRTPARHFMPSGSEVHSWQCPPKKQEANPKEDVVEAEGEAPNE